MNFKKKTLLDNNVWGFAFVMPWIVYFLILQVYPFIMSIKTSFMDINLIVPEKAKFVGLGNFITVLGSKDFWIAFGNVLYNQAIFIPLLIVLAYFVAVLISEIKHFQSFYRVVYFLPIVISVTVGMILFKFLVDAEGVIPTLLLKLGILKQSYNWMNSTIIPMPMLALFSLWKWLGISMIVLLAGLSGLDPELEEAAFVDGANWWQRLIKIKTPLLRPQFTFLIAINIISGLQMFTEVFIPFGLNGGIHGVITTPVILLYREAFTNMKMGYGSAVGIILAAIICIFTLVQIRVTDSKAD